MRIISQDGTIDIPYELSMIWIRGKYGYSVMANMPNDDPVGLGMYSLREKALKAMKMLREEYFETEHEKVYRDGTYYFLPVFQFPKDDEVEV